MDAAKALTELTEVSSQVQAAVICDRAGKVAGSTLRDEARTQAVVAAVQELLGEAGRLRGEPTQVHAATATGSVFVVREGETLIVATTDVEPTAGLVLYDLRNCLRKLEAPTTRRPRRRTPAPKTDASA